MENTEFASNPTSETGKKKAHQEHGDGKEQKSRTTQKDGEGERDGGKQGK